jgi:hypothetical protein
MNAHAPILKQQKQNSLLRWKPWIVRAIRDTDLMTYEDIEKGVLEERYIYFDIGTAFAVIDFQQYTKGNVCHILAAGGSLSGLRDLQHHLMPFFKAIGARRLVQAGRLGWKKILPAWGWKQKHVIMELEIDG